MKRKLYQFSKKEISHLAVSVLVMSFVIAYSMVAGSASGLAGMVAILFAMPVSFVIIAPAFVLHELGHKFASQKYGFYAEYRMWRQGLFLALLVTIMSGGSFIFIAPGAVYFGGGHGRATTEKTAKIGLAGPLVNLLLVACFGAVGILGTGIWAVIGATGAFVNAWLAIFNMIPFGPLDGQKIFAWDKKIWGLVLGLAVIAFITSLAI